MLRNTRIRPHLNATTATSPPPPGRRLTGRKLRPKQPKRLSHDQRHVLASLAASSASSPPGGARCCGRVVVVVGAGSAAARARRRLRLGLEGVLARPRRLGAHVRELAAARGWRGSILSARRRRRRPRRGGRRRAARCPNCTSRRRTRRRRRPPRGTRRSSRRRRPRREHAANVVVDARLVIVAVERRAVRGERRVEPSPAASCAVPRLKCASAAPGERAIDRRYASRAPRRAARPAAARRRTR